MGKHKIALIKMMASISLLILSTAISKKLIFIDSMRPFVMIMMLEINDDAEKGSIDNDGFQDDEEERCLALVSGQWPWGKVKAAQVSLKCKHQTRRTPHVMIIPRCQSPTPHVKLWGQIWFRIWHATKNSGHTNLSPYKVEKKGNHPNFHLKSIKNVWTHMRDSRCSSAAGVRECISLGFLQSLTNRHNLCTLHTHRQRVLAKQKWRLAF